MESIMTLVINESDEISPDLLKPLLDSARKENQVTNFALYRFHLIYIFLVFYVIWLLLLHVLLFYFVNLVSLFSQTISPISWTLAEKVITSCAVKLTPFLMKAVESSGRSLHDYPQIVTSICQNRLIASPKAVVRCTCHRQY